MMNREEVIRIISEICDSYADIIGRVILFGSYSRNEANVGSDIDLFIEPRDVSVTTARFASSKRYFEFRHDLHTMIPLPFDMLAYGGKRDLNRMKNSSLWKQIEKDGVVVYDQRTKAL